MNSDNKAVVRWIACLLIFAGALLAAQGAIADTVPFYNTGVDNSYNPLPGGSPDPHYTMTTISGNVILNNASAIVMSISNYWTGSWGGWVNPTDARWIYNADVGDSGIRGLYDFKTTFDLTGYIPSTAQLTFVYAMDQYGDVYLNGVHVASLPDHNWGASISPNLNPFSISSGFQDGINTLEFYITLPDGYDGLVISDSSLTATPIPIPAALPLFGSGLAGLLVWRRFRKS